jgi:hypothetical protein
MSPGQVGSAARDRRLSAGGESPDRQSKEQQLRGFPNGRQQRQLTVLARSYFQRSSRETIETMTRRHDAPHPIDHQLERANGGRTVAFSKLVSKELIFSFNVALKVRIGATTPTAREMGSSVSRMWRVSGFIETTNSRQRPDQARPGFQHHKHCAEVFGSAWLSPPRMCWQRRLMFAFAI